MRVIVVAALALSKAVAQQCTNGAPFNISLQNLQCIGLILAPNVTTSDACAQMCCANTTCQVWEFCPAGQHCGGEGNTPGPSCWTGIANAFPCGSGSNWQGAARYVPPPALLPQNFLSILPSAPPLSIVDLSSTGPEDTSWTLTIDGRSTRPILVPYGGYNSDEQAQPWIAATSVQSQAVYSRLVALPSSLDASQRLVIEFGAVNHGAEVYFGPSTSCQQQQQQSEVEGLPTVVGAHYGPLMSFSIDVTDALLAGCGVYNLTVVSHPFNYFQGLVPSSFLYAETWTKPSDGFSSRTPAGISKFVRLAVYSSVRFADLFVRPSVMRDTLFVDVTVRNDGNVTATVNVTGMLSAWNDNATWAYPSVPSVALDIPAGGNASTTMTVQWGLGPASYWWPNRPFSESYTPQLHWLNLSIIPTGSNDEPIASSLSQRFGFVEWGEGPYFYTVNGVRMNHLSDATPEMGMSYYDAYVSPAFLYATEPGTGAQETWRRYMRVGMTSNRIHQSTPTQVMMDAADEVGFVLKPESPMRGCPGYEPCDTSSGVFTQSVQELMRWCRNHPSMFAYSIENESSDDISGLIDAATAVDWTRPLTTEGSGGQAWYNGTGSAHAYNMLHYAVPPSTTAYIRGVGECAWCVANGMESYSSLALAGRIDDVAYYAGWDWINYWSNFLEGMNASRHAWQQQPCQARDRMDGVDGWGSPVVDWVQRALHPFLVLDIDTTRANPIYNGTGWPHVVDSYSFSSSSGGAGGTLAPMVTRNLTLFQEVLRGDLCPWANATASGADLAPSCANTTAGVTVAVSLVWDDPATGPAVGHDLAGPFPFTPGFQREFQLIFAVPDPSSHPASPVTGATHTIGGEHEMVAPSRGLDVSTGQAGSGRKLFTVLQVQDQAGNVMYTEDRLYLAITP